MEHKIARFTERVTFQKNSVTVDKYMNHITGWNDYYTCFTYASTYDYDKEKNGVIVREKQTITFEVRYCSELKDLNSTEYRVFFKGKGYNIESVDMMNYQKKIIRVRCVVD